MYIITSGMNPNEEHIAHSKHKYLARIKNGLNGYRYFYTQAALDAYNKVGTAAKIAGATAKALYNSEREIRGIMKEGNGRSREYAKNEIKKRNTLTTLKRAGLTPGEGWHFGYANQSGPIHLVNEATDNDGNKYYISAGSRRIVKKADYESRNQAMRRADKEAWNNPNGTNWLTKDLIKKQKNKAKKFIEKLKI